MTKEGSVMEDKRREGVSDYKEAKAKVRCLFFIT